ncbi:MAG: hypothetical protein ACFUZC_14465 [Chthoniobacteraceae bacterium]
MKPALFCLWALLLSLGGSLVGAQSSLDNTKYRITPASDGAVTLQVAGMPPQRLTGEFTVLWSETNCGYKRIFTHPNYGIAPRNAVRWCNPDEPLAALNAWLASPELRAATGLTGTVREAGGKQNRVWEFKDAKGKTAIQVNGKPALDTTRPFTVGTSAVLTPSRCTLKADRICWEYAPQTNFALSAELILPPGEGDPILAYTIIPKVKAFFSAAFTGAPEAPVEKTLPVPQECDARGHKLFGFVMCEADLHLPRAHVATVGGGNIALVADPGECRFRLPTFEDSRFGLMLSRQNGTLKPVLIAPLLGGAESKMHSGAPWQFKLRCVVRGGDWKETYVHIARDVQGFRDQRDNTGPGSLNGTLERVADFLADRRGGNHALWDPQQKYYDYFTDKTGIFKPFSPLYGLSVAIATDDETLFNERALPAVEYALSRRNSVFAPYDNVDNKQATKAGREVGAPYLGYVQLMSLDALFGGRSPVLRALAEAKGPAKGRLEDTLALWRATGGAALLTEAQAEAAKLRKSGNLGEDDLFDLLDLAAATREPGDIQTAIAAAYANAAQLNLYPTPPDTLVTVDRGGLAPVHPHSVMRHHNIWGFPPPQPLHVPEATVPAWRLARYGVPGPAYPMEYWMNTHGAMMSVAALAHDGFLRDLAHSGMVGRFGNYPGDNRSINSLVAEIPDTVERMPWDWNFATVNPGHAWDFAGAVLDFLVSDACERSQGAIGFPTLSAAGSHFRVRIYGAKPGKFYGDNGVHLWIPRGLVTTDNRQLDWLAGHGNGNLYLAVWNQSLSPQTADITLDPAWAECDPQRDARVWRDNAAAVPVRVTGNRLRVTLAPRGITAFAIPATVKPRLQARLYDPATPALGPGSFIDTAAPFGPVHAMLLRAGSGLTRAFVYTDALPENVIAARLRWRQGNGPWQEQTDGIYPYEFSPGLSDNGGDFTCVMEVENAKEQIETSPAITLRMEAGCAPTVAKNDLPAASAPAASPAPQPSADPGEFSRDFIGYIQAAANGNHFGLRADGRFYPYSTPQGRRIGARQLVWDNALFGKGCTPEEAEEHLKADLNRAQAELTRALAARSQPVAFANLDRRQQETLLDFAYSETAANISPALVSAVLARDWARMVNEHLYVRYAGHAPDHPRNKAFAQRWSIP